MSAEQTDSVDPEIQAVARASPDAEPLAGPFAHHPRAESSPLLARIDDVLGGTGEVDASYWKIFEAVRSALPVEAFLIDLVDPVTRIFNGAFYLDTVDNELKRVAPPGGGNREIDFMWEIANGRRRLILRRDGETPDPGDTGGMYGNFRPSLSLMYVPLQSRGRPLGVMSAQTYAEGSYTEEHLERLASIASISAPSLEIHAQAVRIRRQLDQVQSINRVMQAINNKAELREAMESVLSEAVDFLHVDFGSIYAYEEGQLVLQASHGLTGRHRDTMRTLSLEEKPQYREAFVRREALADHGGSLSDDEKRLGMQSVANRPIVHNERILGTILLGSIAYASFSADMTRYLEILAGQIAGAIHAHALRRRAAVSEGRLRTFFDSSPDAIMILDADGRIIDWNSTTTALFDYTPADMRRQSLLTLMSPDEARRRQSILERPVTSPLTLPECIFRRGSGVEFRGRASLAPLGADADHTDAYSLQVRDLTAEERLRRQTEATELRYSKLIEALADVVFTAMPGDPPAFASISRAIEEWVPFTAEQLVRNPGLWLRCVLEEDRAYVTRRGALFDERQPVSLQYRLEGRDGEVRLIQEYVMPILDDKGVLVRLDGAFTELSQSRRIEQRIIESERQKGVKILASGLSHELNNIFTGIVSTASFARRAMEDGSLAQRYFAIIEKSGMRARALTDKLLAYSGTMHKRLERLSLNEAIGRLLTPMHAGAAAGLMIECRLGADVPYVDADPTLTDLALRNLVMNAAEASEGCGRLVISTSHLETNASLPGVSGPIHAGRYVSVSVRDDGAGVSPSELGKIFEPFITTKSTGRGLGLPACEGVMRAHDGYVGVESAPREGSTFHLYFPLTQLVDRGEGAPATPRRREGRTTVLLVDSDQMIREMTGNMLRGQGYLVELADNALEAVTIYRQRMGTIDLVLLDATASSESAERAFADVRNINPFARIIVTAGAPHSELREMIDADGNSGFLRKPYRRADLFAAIERALR